ncbi:MAG: YiiD C-terminal domain-containing protein [Bacteroidetes bacterium]|nr:YiiD C-terminal domain-containing protein [Bacteroidota bacterium]
MHHKLFKLLFNFYPPYLFTGIKIEHISPDYRQITVTMKLHFYNKNYVGTHFGGSLFSMTDPFLMTMLIKNLGKDYLVWDQKSCIKFLKPGRGTVKAEFNITEKLLNEIKENTKDRNKYFPQFETEIIDEQGIVVANVTKTIYVKRKN